MGSDVVVEERHRREAARVVNELNPEYVEYWVLSGAWREPRHLMHAEFLMDRTAQSLANLEATIRSEYKGVVGAAGLVRAEFETYGEAKASSAACRNLVARLEKLNDG